MLTSHYNFTLLTQHQGVPSKSIAAEVDTMIRSVGLVEKRNEKSASLSGGQKRKLSVGIAFIGGSRVVFLDEVQFCKLQLILSSLC
jgi:ABC-type multidrug transport system ATPase subunit